MSVTADTLVPRGMPQFHFDSYPEPYQSALQAYWAGDKIEALDQITAALADDPDRHLVGACYRFWIEILADSGDHSSLQALTQHLRLRAIEADEETAVTFYALCGLAHFEIDEYETACLLAKTVVAQDDNAYAMELNHMVASRTQSQVVYLYKTTSGLDDYFHWQRLAQVSRAEGDEEMVRAILKTIGQVFPKSPLPHTATFHDAVSDNDFATALNAAQHLVQLYPDHPDFHFFVGVAHLHGGSPGFALPSFEKSLGLSEEDSPEIILAIGECHHRMARFEDAMAYYKKARRLFEESGTPTQFVDEKIAEVNSYTSPDAEVIRPVRMWFVCLSPRKYYELQNEPEHEVKRLYRPMGTVPRPGDLCFFASLPAKASDTAKIGAIYSVDSEPLKDGMHRAVTALNLVARPSGGIPVDMQIAEEDFGIGEAFGLSPDHPYYHGVFELELGALDIITEAIKRRNDEREGAHDLASELAKLKLG